MKVTTGPVDVQLTVDQAYDVLRGLERVQLVPGTEAYAPTCQALADQLSAALRDPARPTALDEHTRSTVRPHPPTPIRPVHRNPETGAVCPG